MPELSREESILITAALTAVNTRERERLERSEETGSLRESTKQEIRDRIERRLELTNRLIRDRHANSLQHERKV